MNFNSKIIYLNKLDHSISFWHKIVNNYIQYKLKKSSNETIFDFPIPDFYYGYNDEFLRQDFFNIDVLDTSLLEDERLWLLIDNWINLFLRKLSLTNEFEKIYNLKSIKENINYFVYTDLKKVKIWLIKRWNKKNNIYSTLSRFNKPDYLEITPQNILSNLKKKKFIKTSTIEKKFYKIPEFIKEFFFLILQPNIDINDIDYFCISKFKTILPVSKVLDKSLKQKVNKFLGPLQVFKTYFSLAHSYDLKNPTIAYQVLKKILKDFPNKDMLVRRTEPYGINPFYTIPKILTKNDVDFPELISDYNFYLYKKKKYSLLNKNSNSRKEMKESILINKKNLFILKSILSFLFYTSFPHLFFFSKIISFLPSYNVKKYLKKINLTPRLFINKSYNSSVKFSQLDYDYKKFAVNINFTKNYVKFKRKKKLTNKNFALENWDNSQFSNAKRYLLFLHSSNAAFLKWELFSKRLERNWTLFVINTMQKLLWLNYYFKQESTSLSILYKEIYQLDKTLNFNYIENQKLFHLNYNYISYSSSYMNFVWSYFFSKYFFYNFSSLFELRLKNV